MTVKVINFAPPRIANSIQWAQRLAIFLCVTLAFATVPAVAQQTLKSGYTFTDLGTLGTDTMSNAMAINNAGQVVGVSTSTIPDALSIINYAEGAGYGYGADYQFYYGNAYIWNPDTPNAATGTLVRLALLPGLTCTNPNTGLPIPRNDEVWDINANGVAVGSSSAYLTDCQSFPVTHGVSWANGALTDLGVPTGDTNPAVQSEAKSINDLGQIVGDWGLSYAWFYNGAYSILGSLNTSLVAIGKINNAGTIVGTVGNLGFIHNGTGPLVTSDLIGTLGGTSTSSGAFSINQTGMVVGNSYLGSSPVGSHAFLIDPFQVPLNSGTMQDLGVASSDPSAYSSATAINNNANHLAVIIVGYSIVDPNAYWLSPEHAVMWQNIHNIIDLNTLLDEDMQPPYNTLSPCANSSGCWELMTANGVNDKGQIVGEALFVPNGQSDGVLHGYMLSAPCANAGGDSDGDGLCDDYEINGYPLPDGTKIDLHAMGANPNHKDVFVQVDYLFSSTHNHMLKSEANLALVQAFALAPVSNPDGTTGINLHIDCGPTCIMDPVTGTSWGTSGSTQSFSTGFPESAYIPFGSANPDGTWNNAQLLQFINPLNPSGTFAMEYSLHRYHVFHYALMAHTIGGFPGPQVTLGYSGTVPGSWLITGLALANSDPPVGSALLQAVVLMHELGHNLGLQHGGLDAVNYKPNYLSIMNYAFSEYGLYYNGSDGLLDYSRFPSIPSLNKQSLNEAVGLNAGPAIPGYGTRYYCPGGIQGNSTGLRNVANANGPIDWNCDGNATESGVNANINADPSSCSIIGPAATSLCFTLYSSSDWNHLIFTGGTIGADQAEAVANTNLISSEPGTVPDTVPVVPYLVEVASSGNAQVTPSANLNLTFTITNKGLNEDTYNLTFSTQYNWYNPVNLLSTVTLASGASQEIIVPVTVPANFGCVTLSAIKALFSLKAVSQTYPAILDAGYAELDLEPTPGTSIVPALFGLTQTAAEAGIVNAGFVLGTVTTEYDQYYAAGTVVNQSPNSCITAAAGSTVNLTVSLGVQTFTVPNLVGTNESGASAAITAAGLVVGSITPVMSATVPEFLVISQTPAGGSEVAAGTVVNFAFSEANLQLVQVPDFTSGEISAILAAGFTVGTLTPELSSLQRGALVSQDPAAGSFASLGASVNIVYSAGPALVAIPDVVGQWQWTAEDNLFLVEQNNDQGYFNATIARQSSTTVPDGDVISQSPVGGTLAVPYSTVNLVVSSGGTVTATVPNLIAPPIDYFSPVLSSGILYFATAPIMANGFAVGTVTTQPSSTVPFGYIISQSPAAGTVAPWNTSIDLTVSLGNVGGAGTLQYQIPDLVGLTQEAAVGLLNQGLPDPYLGDYFTYTFITQTSGTVPAGTVISQTPPAGPGYLALYQNEEFGPINMVISAGPKSMPTYAYSGLIAGSDNYDDPSLGTLGFNPAGGVGGPGIVTPAGIAIDPVTRNIIAGDTVSGTLQLFAPNGQFKGYFAGDGLIAVGPAPNAFQSTWPQFFPGESNGNGLLVGYPAAIAVDPVNENVVVVDYGGDRVLIYNSAGQFQSVFGSRGNAAGQFSFAAFETWPGVAIDSATENILVTDPGNARVEIFNSAGVFQSQFGSYGSGKGQFYAPSGIAIDPVSRNIIVTDPIGDTVQSFSPAGVYLSQIGTAGLSDGQFNYPSSIAIDPVSRNVVVGDSAAFPENAKLQYQCRVQIFDLNDNYLGKFGGTGGTAAACGGPTGALSMGQSIVVDPLNRNIVTGFANIEIFSLQNGAAATTTTVVSSLNPANVGQPVTFTATVIGNNPTGTIQFMDGTTVLGSPVTVGSSMGTLTISTLTAGTHSITAVYRGDTSNAASTSSVFSEVINTTLATSTTSIVSSLNPITVGQAVSFTATVAGSSPTGTVQFKDGSTALLSPVALSSGSATLTLSTLTVGTHSVTAVYSGDSNNSPSASSAYSEIVNLHSTTTTVTSSLNPATTGQSVTFTATVTGASPTGTVQFFDSATALLTPATLTGGSASVTLSTLAAGTHTITAVYSGDGSNSPSTSSALSEVISALATSPEVTAPASISIPATQATGATAAAWPALAAFLAGATAAENITPAPVQIPPQAGGVGVTSTTLFPVGTTTVTFSFRDSNGNVGSATSTVTVAVGVPRITGSMAGVGSDPSGATYFNVVLTNTGTGNAVNLVINTLTVRVLSGTGTVAYNTALSPALPLSLGNLSVGTAVATRIYLNVSSTATRISITEGGPVQDVTGTNYSYSTAEAVVP
jgi:beta-lactam-binding protein with PASTA domain